ncbi:MAG TPA: GNAT family N-acetyltransferase [Gemmatimonadaceae bacterium]
MPPTRVALRSLGSSDLDAAVALVREAAGGTRYEQGAVEALTAAVLTPGVEARATGAFRDGSLAGVLVHGEFAGAIGAGRLHVVTVAAPWRAGGIGHALVGHAARELRARGARFVLAEVADDAPALGAYRAFLARCGFREESRVADLVADGVALTFLRQDLAAER